MTERSENLTIQVSERRGNLLAALLVLLGDGILVLLLLTVRPSDPGWQWWQILGFVASGTLALAAGWTLYAVTTTVTINRQNLRLGRRHWPLTEVRGFLSRRWVPKRMKAKEALPVYQLLVIFRDGQEVALLEHRDDHMLAALAAKMNQFL